MKQDKKFSFIIPYTDDHKDKVLRAENSINESDYKNVEIIKVHDKDRRGASWARNQGARKATGDILFFFDADCFLLPGVLTQIMLEWAEDPDADFIYGQYRYFGPDLEVYPSRGWNPYVLESMNYISTMSPMKREMFDRVGGFRVGLKWFQDWDFFLRAAKDGCRGRFLKIPFFNTDKPDEKSISGNPETPYWEKVRHVQKINFIPRKPICVATFGAPFQAEYRAEALGADYLGSNMETELAWMPGMWGEHDYRMIYVMGFYPKGGAAHAMLFNNAPDDCKRVIHWIGTDVYQMRTSLNWLTIQAFKEDILAKMDHQLTTSDVLTRELAELDIKAETVYAPIDADKFPLLSPANGQFAVGCYVSDTNPAPHNEDFLQQVALSLPQVKFFFFGRERLDTYRNIEYIGRVENMRDVLMETHVNLRMTKHDGLPQTVVQYLMSGRDAVTNADVKHARNILQWPHEAEDFGAVKTRVIAEIMRCKRERKTPEQRKQIRNYWVKRTDPMVYRKKLYSLLPDGDNEATQDDVGSANAQQNRLPRGNGREYPRAVD